MMQKRNKMKEYASNKKRLKRLRNKLRSTSMKKKRDKKKKKV